MGVQVDVGHRGLLVRRCTASLPDATDRIDAAEPYVAEDDWAAACLTRVRGRLGDDRALTEAGERWGRLGARFERAATLALLPDRVEEGRAELAALGCRVTGGSSMAGAREQNLTVGSERLAP